MNVHLPEDSRVNKLHLRRLFILRNLFVIAQLIAFFIAILFLNINLHVLPLLLVTTSLVIFNFVVWLRLKRTDSVFDNEIFNHLLFDVAALTAVLYFSGGASNPFITLFIFPIIVSVTVLPARFAWILSGVTLLSYSFLMIQYVPIEMGMSMNMGKHEINDTFNLHIAGMWLAFALSAGLVAHFVVKMGSTIRSQDEQLQKARESALRDRQIIELGTLAASTAHELGTPLGTMNLLIPEIKKELPDASPQVHHDITLLKQQIDRCKDALANLSAAAGAINLSSGSVLPVTDYLSKVLKDWKLTQPYIHIKTVWNAQDAEASILDDKTLNQALVNILDNAAEASPKNIEWDATWDDKSLIMEIRDRGQGLSEDIKDQVGRIPITQKEHGLGLGLFLSHAIIERFGGSVYLINREGGGMVTRIVFPLLNVNST